VADQESDFYQKIRKGIRKWAKTKEGKSNKWVELILLAPDLFHLLCRLMAEKNVAKEEKAKLAVAIAYFVSPIDLIPEGVVGPVGFTDDIALAAFVLNGLINKTDAELVIKHWAGEQDILQVIKRIIAVADEMVGSGLWRKVRDLFG